MGELVVGVVRSVDQANHRAAVQLPGAAGLWAGSIPLARHIGRGTVGAGDQVAVALLEPGDYDQALIVGAFGAATRPRSWPLGQAGAAGGSRGGLPQAAGPLPHAGAPIA
jgi:hypothetical protein